ncbi:catechol O-methyltransferase [Neoconidiobolus thromboides FSU 785]|nr:catechol O-methyltransferase [Neoconidiobolus thromboides FSU 785]
MDINYKQVQNVLKHIFSHATEGNPESVIKAFESYFYQTEHIMIVGEKKGSILKEHIQAKQPKVILELGGYIGYSAIFMAQLIKDIPGAHFYSVEFDPILVCVMEKVLKFAGLQDKVTVLSGNLKAVLSELKEVHKVEKVDLFFLDHIKTEYLNDFKLANEAKLFHSNSIIIADNVIWPGAPDYVEYVSNHQDFESKTYEFLLEAKGHVHTDGIMVTKVKV